MQFPFGFPVEARARVVQSELEARKHLKKSVRRSRRKDDDENFRKYVLRVFLGFAQEACKLGLAGKWGVDKVRSEVPKFLDNFWSEAYDEFRGRLVISQPPYRPSWGDLEWEFGSSAEWRQFEDQLLAVAEAQSGGPTRPLQPQIDSEAVSQNHSCESVLRKLQDPQCNVLTTPEVAAYFGVTPRTVYRWNHDGKLRDGVKRGTITTKSIKKFERQRAKPRKTQENL